MKLALVLSFVACGSLLLLGAGDGTQVAGTEAVPPVTGGVATLHALDGEWCSMNLLTGGPGGAVQAHETRNFGSHFDFGRYRPGELTVGIQGGEAGRIVDLGSAADLQQHFGYGDTVPGRQGFSSIHLESGHFVIRGAPGGDEPFQECPDANRLLSDAGVSDHAPIALDHIYVLRITDRNDPAFDLRAKLHVIGYQPGQSMTVRWERLTP